MCVTADCSLVPRAPADKKSWEADLYPNVPVIALRLDVERGRLFDESLTNATRGRHLFITLDGERLSLRISTEDARQPRPEIFILEKNCVEPGFRHSFGTLLKANGEDVKTAQELLRHANSRITLDVCTQAVNSNKRAAQSKVVRMIVSNVGQEIKEKYPQTRQ